MLLMRPPCSYIDITYSFCQYKPFSYNLFFLNCLFCLTKMKWYCSIFLSLSERYFTLHQPIIIIYSRHIPKWAGWQRESFSGLWEHWWTWLSLLSYSRATPTLPTTQNPILAPSRDAAGSPALFLNSYLDILACPWPWMVTMFLADVHQPVSKACCHHHPAWLTWLRCYGAATHQCGRCPPAPCLPLAPSTPALKKPLACTAPWQWNQTLLSPELGTMETGPHGGPVAPAVLQTPTLHSRAALAPHRPQPFHADWARVWGFLHQMWLKLPALPRGQQASAPQHHSLLTLRKGPKLCHLVYGANGCLWSSHKPLQ